MGAMNFLDLQQWIIALYTAGMSGQIPRLWIESYAYNLTFTGIAAGGSATQNVTINSNADFVLTQISHRANVAAAGQTVSTKTAPLARVQITDTGSARPFFNSAVDLENFSANADPNRIMPFPRWVAGNTTLTTQVTSYEASQTLNIDLCLAGVSVRRYSEPLATVIGS
jgi:ABC-type Fe3+-siderophore transport system permease subunit